VALAREALQLRSLAQDLMREQPSAKDWQRPKTTDLRVLAVAAALTELLAMRLGQEPPDWTARIGALPEPLYLVQAAERLRRLRELCQQESPAPLKKRGILAPPNFLEFA
jgi:hypothetical protein